MLVVMEVTVLGLVTVLEVGDQVVVVEVMGSGQRSILRCEAANTAAGTSTILAK